MECRSVVRAAFCAVLVSVARAQTIQVKQNFYSSADCTGDATVGQTGDFMDFDTTTGCMDMSVTVSLTISGQTITQTSASSYTVNCNTLDFTQYATGDCSATATQSYNLVGSSNNACASASASECKAYFLAVDSGACVSVNDYPTITWATGYSSTKLVAQTSQTASWCSWPPASPSQPSSPPSPSSPAAPPAAPSSPPAPATPPAGPSAPPAPATPPGSPSAPPMPATPPAAIPSAPSPAHPPPAPAPFSPLTAGMSLKVVQATTIQVEFTAAGTVSDFVSGSAALTSLESKLATALACFPPTCTLEVNIVSASVGVQVTATLPDTGGAGSNAAAISATTAAATQLSTLPASGLSTTLGVTAVSGLTPPTTRAITMTVVVAPPPPTSPPPTPPSPPPSPPSPPPAPPPPPPPLDVACGCDMLMGGLAGSPSTSSYFQNWLYTHGGGELCVKLQEVGPGNVKRACYPGPNCPSDMASCNGQTSNTCFDTKPAFWCAKKLQKGRCRKEKVRTKKCRKTCGTCM